MKVRNVRTDDLPRLREIFDKQGFDYDLPDFTHLLAAQVIVDASDVPIMAIGAKMVAELYLLADKDWGTPGMRFVALGMVHETFRGELRRCGIDRVTIWLPPQIAKTFGKRLVRSFGWMANKWANFTRFTDER